MAVGFAVALGLCLLALLQLDLSTGYRWAAGPGAGLIQIWLGLTHRAGRLHRVLGKVYLTVFG